MRALKSREKLVLTLKRDKQRLPRLRELLWHVFQILELEVRKLAVPRKKVSNKSSFPFHISLAQICVCEVGASRVLTREGVHTRGEGTCVVQIEFRSKNNKFAV